MSNTKKPIDKNLIYIGVVTAVILAAILIIAIKNRSTSDDAGVQEAPTAAKISVISENGNQQATIKADVEVREISFDKTKKEIKAYEKKQKDTLDDPSEATSTDNYTYLSYRFNPEHPANFYGTQVSTTDGAAMLTYVFHGKQLIEVRIQYGKIGEAEYNKLIAANTSSFGEATYSRTYSNGTKESWWKTKKITLDVLCQNEDVIAYYRNNKAN